MKCPYCGYSFRADPDDPSLYRGGRFDLTVENSPPTSRPLFSDLTNFRDYFQIQRIVVLVLFTLLFLNLYKAFSGFEWESSPQEERIRLEGEQPTPEPSPGTIPDTENLYQI